MDFKQIEAFVNVIKYKGFSKAAEATFLTQPTISAHVNALEKELQLQLIDRTKKEALPTAEGKLFYNYALTMLNTREQAIYSLQNFSLNINGTIGIQSSSIPGEYIVPGLIADFKKEYGKAKFYLEQSDSSLVADNIKAHKGEIGFTGHKENDGLTYKLLMKDKAVLITPQVPHFKEREGERLQLKDFIGEPFLLRERGSATRETFEKELDAKGIPHTSMNVAASMNSMEAIKQAVRGGMGVSIISEVAADRQRADRGYLVFDLEDYDEEREFYLVYNDKITMSPTAETFKFFVLEKYGYKFDY
ncbi:selenium metabolism-associated LysR family transcriptional regulator [Eubacteriales bacterium DFI.9.88]|uniref:selenium metabolism-associated LysR family transcriptional regulator n=1 Tax=Hominibacterium faecale TaxID=2839743 RepID=UPI0022B29C5A|nr:selenium metabolism-associated LysR family transcriptional regulator [Hominibacterium faecale]MDE8733680.1 selenium metabolism-associated LysR family transcriptional regulator [Eubacteriales bacterium DFI.9.88]